MRRSNKPVNETKGKRARAFKIWYADYSVTGDTIAEWERASNDDVQVVAFYFDEKYDNGEHVRLLSYGKDEYSLNKFMELDPDAPAKKKGTNVSDKTFNKVLEEAKADKGLDWILPNVTLKQTPDFGGKMIDIPEGDRSKTLSKNRGKK